MKLIYIAGPLRAKTRVGRQANIDAAVEYGKQVAALGAMPIVPHILTGPLADCQPEAFWLEATMQLMLRCHAVLTMPNWMESKGAIAERTTARQLHMPTFDYIGGLRLWLQNGVYDVDL